MTSCTILIPRKNHPSLTALTPAFPRPLITRVLAWTRGASDNNERVSGDLVVSFHASILNGLCLLACLNYNSTRIKSGFKCRCDHQLIIAETIRDVAS